MYLQLGDVDNNTSHYRFGLLRHTPLCLSCIHILILMPAISSRWLGHLLHLHYTLAVRILLFNGSLSYQTLGTHHTNKVLLLINRSLTKHFRKQASPVVLLHHVEFTNSSIPILNTLENLPILKHAIPLLLHLHLQA